MANHCATCDHPERAAIEIGLASGVSQRVLGLRYGLNQAQLSRHRSKHMSVPADTSKNRGIIQQCVKLHESGVSISQISKVMGFTDAEAKNYLIDSKLFSEVSEEAPWIALAKQDMEAASAMFAIEFCERFIPRLVSIRSTDDLNAAARQAFIETVEAA